MMHLVIKKNYRYFNKYRIQETLNLLACLDPSTARGMFSVDNVLVKPDLRLKTTVCVDNFFLESQFNVKTNVCEDNLKPRIRQKSCSV